MLTMISPTGSHGFQDCVFPSVVPYDSTYDLERIMSQSFEPEPPENNYVNPQLLQPNNGLGSSPGRYNQSP